MYPRRTGYWSGTIQGKVCPEGSEETRPPLLPGRQSIRPPWSEEVFAVQPKRYCLQENVCDSLRFLSMRWAPVPSISRMQAGKGAYRDQGERTFQHACGIGVKLQNKVSMPVARPRASILQTVFFGPMLPTERLFP